MPVFSSGSRLKLELLWVPKYDARPKNTTPTTAAKTPSHASQTFPGSLPHHAVIHLLPRREQYTPPVLEMSKGNRAEEVANVLHFHMNISVRGLFPLQRECLAQYSQTGWKNPGVPNHVKTSTQPKYQALSLYFRKETFALKPSST